MKPIYTAVVTSVGGRSGNTKSSDGVLNLTIRPPKDIGGPEGAYTNPEQLFAAGYSACFGGALSHVALKRGIRVRPEVTAKVTLYKEDIGGYQIGVELDVNVSGVDMETAKELAEAAHKSCPYSKATHNNIQFILNVTNK